MTSHICFGCAKLVANSGLRRVVVRADAAALHRDPERSYRFLYDCGLDVLAREADRVWEAYQSADGTRTWYAGPAT